MDFVATHRDPTRLPLDSAIREGAAQGHHPRCSAVVCHGGEPDCQRYRSAPGTLTSSRVKDEILIMNVLRSTTAQTPSSSARSSSLCQILEATMCEKDIRVYLWCSSDPVSTASTTSSASTTARSPQVLLEGFPCSNRYCSQLFLSRA